MKGAFLSVRRYRPSNEFDYKSIATDLKRKNSEMVQALGMVRLDRENLSVLRFGLGKTAGAMMSEGRSEKTGEILGHHAF